MTPTAKRPTTTHTAHELAILTLQLIKTGHRIIISRLDLSEDFQACGAFVLLFGVFREDEVGETAAEDAEGCIVAFPAEMTEAVSV